MADDARCGNGQSRSDASLPAYTETSDRSPSLVHASRAIRRHPRSILIIDNDRRTADALDCAFRARGFRTRTAARGADGISLALAIAFDLLLIELVLPDMPGIDIVRVLQRETRSLSFILIGAFLTIPATVEAMKLGAVEVLEKPIVADELAARVCEVLDAPQTRAPRMSATTPALSRRPASSTMAHVVSRPRSAAERWAALVFKACESDGDLRTLEQWAAWTGVSYTTLCENCRLVHVRPHDARDLARMLRVVIKSREQSCHLDVLLDISDRRTLRTLLDRSGLSRGSPAGSISVDYFLRHQRFITHENEGLMVLTELLGRAGQRDRAP